MNFDSAAISKSLSADYEMARRQLRRDVNELRLLAEATLKRSSSRLAGLVEKYSEEMKAALDKLSEEDGWKEWRVDESLRLTHLAQERISKTQNPPNCSKAKKIVCHLNYACGFGCQVVFRCFFNYSDGFFYYSDVPKISVAFQVHHAAYCLATAVATKRTLVFSSKHWKYSKCCFLKGSSTKKISIAKISYFG